MICGTMGHSPGKERIVDDFFKEFLIYLMFWLWLFRPNKPVK